MRKSKLLAGQYGVYVAYDKVSKHYISMHFASTDADFIRLYLPKIIIDTPLRDLQIFKIGIFNDVTGAIKPIVKKRIPTDCYLFPHFRLSPLGENESLENIQKTLIETKNEIIAQLSSFNEDNSNKEEVNENE